MSTALDAILPRYDFRKINQRQASGCSTAEAYDSLLALTCAEIKLLAPLFALRLLPDKLLGKPSTFDPKAGFLAEFKKTGFLVARETRPDEVVLTLIGKLWRYDSLDTIVPLKDEESFCAFAEPEYIKVVTNFAFAPAQNSGTLLSTETRILATCDRSRQLFGTYWRCIRWGSGLLRDSMLAAIARRAGA